MIISSAKFIFFRYLTKLVRIDFNVLIYRGFSLFLAVTFAASRMAFPSFFALSFCTGVGGLAMASFSSFMSFLSLSTSCLAAFFSSGVLCGAFLLFSATFSVKTLSLNVSLSCSTSGLYSFGSTFLPYFKFSVVKSLVFTNFNAFSVFSM